MTQEEPHRINIKANKIQNNKKKIKKETNLYEQPFITQNSFNTSINDFNFQNQLNNNLHQGEFSSGPQLKNHYLFQTNKISQTKQNINFNPSNNLNIQLNQKDDYSSIKNFESIYKIDNLNKNNININNNKTELIGPIIYNGSYDVNNNFESLFNLLLSSCSKKTTYYLALTSFRKYSCPIIALAILTCF